jgi:hypothetical protein
MNQEVILEYKPGTGRSNQMWNEFKSDVGDITWYVIIAIGCFMLGAFLAGCGSPEAFDIDLKTPHCTQIGPEITEYYSCENGTYRCTHPDGTPKYVNCQIDGTYCVAECP